MKFVRFVAVMLLAVSGVATAQLGSNHYGIVAQVPFDFVVGDKTIPAGKCVVTTVDSSWGAQPLLMIGNSDAKTNLFASASSDERKPAGKAYNLIFDKEGNRYFLRGITVAGSRVIYRLPETRMEAELRAQNVPSTEVNLVASLR